jgi:tetratricopeptide (TPR) repeat protein
MARIAQFILFSLICSAVFIARQHESPTSEVDRLFVYGGDNERERQAFEVLERALKDTPNDYHLLWRAARSYYYFGDGAMGRDRADYFEKGIAASTRAVAENGDGAEGHFWLGSNYGMYCSEKGFIVALKNIGKIRTEFETVLRLNPAYENGATYTALGEIDRQAPRLFGGNIKRAITYLEEGLKLTSTNVGLKESLAEAYADHGQKEDARRQLLELLQMPPSSNAHVLENNRAQEKARKLLAKLGSK